MMNGSNNNENASNNTNRQLSHNSRSSSNVRFEKASVRKRSDQFFNLNDLPQSFAQRKSMSSISFSGINYAIDLLLDQKGIYLS